MSLLLNRAKMTTATTGTGTVTLGSAVSPYQSLSSAGAVNAMIYSYLIEDGSAWEIGTGTYTSSGTTLSRTLDQSSTGSLLNLSGSATVSVVMRTADIPLVVYDSTLSGTAASVTIPGIPGGYSKLQYEVFARANAATASDFISVQYNADTGANYDYYHGTMLNGGVFPLNAFGQTAIKVYWTSQANDQANAFGAILANVINYVSTTGYKNGITDSISNASASANIGRGVGTHVWRNSGSAITSITFTPSSGSFIAGSRFICRVVP